MRVGILGGGRWGQALARLVLAAGHEPLIAYRDRAERPPHILPSTDKPPQVPEACELLIVATSAAELRHALRLAKPTARNTIVVAGRGFEPVSGFWLSDVVRQESPQNPIGALAGPAPIDEILNGGLCAGVAASADADVREPLTAALHSKRYRVYESTDLLGVQLSSAFVQVLATLVGMVTSLRGAGVGLHALVVARGLEEAARLAKAIGAQPTTVAGLAGLGDLVAVQSAPSHPHFQAGVAIARGDRSQAPKVTAERLVAIALESGVELPLTEGLVAILGGVDPLDALADLMARKAVPETR
jgi:glycerol-3-phosphate dehydrogenase (NAD(P)+)